MAFDWETDGREALEVLPDGVLLHDGVSILWVNSKAREILSTEAFELEMFNPETRPTLHVLSIGRLAAVHVELRWIDLSEGLGLLIIRRCTDMPTLADDTMAQLEKRLAEAESKAEVADTRFRRIYEKSGRAVEMADELEARAAEAEQAMEAALSRASTAEDNAKKAEARAEEANVRFRRIYEMSGVEELEKKADEAYAQIATAEEATRAAEEARKRAEMQAQQAHERSILAEQRLNETKKRFQTVLEKARSGDDEGADAEIEAMGDRETEIFALQERALEAEQAAERLKEELKRAVTTSEAARWRSERLERRIESITQRAERAELASREAKDRLRILARNTQLPDTLAFEDPLTGLPRLEMLFVFAEKSFKQDQGVGFLLFDVDRFRQLNDTLGSTAGDELLKEIARRLRMAVNRYEVLGRWEQDRFILIFPADEDSLVKERARALRKCFNGEFNVGGQNFSVDATVSGHRLPFHNRHTMEALLRGGFEALKEAKRRKLPWQMFSQELARLIGERDRLEEQLRRGLEKHEFVLFYQPIFNLRENKIVGLEGLLRWNHPKRGLLGPGSFLETAEELGLILDIGQQVLELACNMAQRLDPKLYVCLNIAPRQLLQAGFPQRVFEALSDYGLAPKRLVLEVSEGIHSVAPAAASRALKELTDGGVGLGIDDFGSGVSSVRALESSEIRFIKIDRALVQGVPSSSAGVAMCRATVGLASSLGIACLAEGIEKAAQQEFLVEADCELGQGYYLCKPLALAELEKRFSELFSEEWDLVSGAQEG